MSQLWDIRQPVRTLAEDIVGDRSTKMEQVMERLLAEIRTNQAKADVNLKELEEEMRAGQQLLKDEMLAKIETYQRRMEINHEKRDAKIDANQEMTSQDRRQ
jgi:hypothetical protein